MIDCLFCKIVAGEISAKKVYEDDVCVAFHDVNPKAPTHLLLVPKQHIVNLYDLTVETLPVAQALLAKAPELAREQGLDAGFRLITNSGEGGGQEVPHLHFHILGDIRQASWTGFPKQTS